MVPLKDKQEKKHPAFLLLLLYGEKIITHVSSSVGTHVLLSQSEQATAGRRHTCRNQNDIFGGGGWRGVKETAPPLFKRESHLSASLPPPILVHTLNTQDRQSLCNFSSHSFPPPYKKKVPVCGGRRCPPSLPNSAPPTSPPVPQAQKPPLHS